MSLQRVHLAADAGFWIAAARTVLAFAERKGAPERQLQALTWVVAGGTQAEAARAGLRTAVGQAFIPPRVVPLAEWLGQPIVSDLGQRLELYAVLRSNRWIGEAFGGQPATLWALAADVARLCDELTLAAVQSVEAFDGRLQSALARHFHRRAARALQAPAQLVLQLWRARRSAGDGAARTISAMAAKTASLESPLVYLGSGLASAASPNMERWEEALLERAARRVEVLHLVPDVAAAVRDRPLLAAAWPELVSAESSGSIARRADALPRTGVAPPLTLAAGATLEEAATAAATQTLAWLREGAGAIALVVLDRLTARRIRALLERADVFVRDETGWKLSTTSAAAAVMRWYDLAQDDLYWRDLLDWLKSGFTLTGRPAKAHEVALIERAIRAGGVVQGLRQVRRAVAEFAAEDLMEHRDGALEVLALIDVQVQAALRPKASLHAHAQALRQSLEVLGMAGGLAADPVGIAVLAELETLEQNLSTHRGAATLAEFRALLALRFEETAYLDRGVESPVVMVSLGVAAMRSFDAAVLVGVDARHLPAAPSEVLFMSNAVRAELGLATSDEATFAQSAQLAALLAATPRVFATWRARVGDEPNPLSPLLQRLQFVCRRALGDDLMREVRPEDQIVEAAVTSTPQPRAPRLLPVRISASHAQSLVDCPYQFYARRMLGLAEPEDVIEMPDKRDFGIALHDVLKRFHRAWGAADFSAVPVPDLAASLNEHARAVFGPQLQRTPGLLAYERRFAALVDGYIDWLQQNARQGWRWHAGEQSHRRSLPLDHVRQVELAGRVDRIDVAADGRTRLIDYKARDPATLRAGLKRRGEDIQLPFYGLLLPHRPESAEYLSFGRAKDDDGGVESVAAPGPFDELIDEVGRRLGADLLRIADGAPLPAIGATSVCRHCEMRGLCRRDHWETGEGVAGGAA